MIIERHFLIKGNDKKEISIADVHFLLDQWVKGFASKPRIEEVDCWTNLKVDNKRLIIEKIITNYIYIDEDK